MSGPDGLLAGCALPAVLLAAAIWLVRRRAA
jgi:hypothetical protein